MSRVIDPRQTKRARCKVVFNSQRQTGVILNISRTGLYLQVSLAAKRGDPLQVEITDDKTGNTISVQAVVSWTRHVPASLRSIRQGGLDLKIVSASPEYYELCDRLPESELPPPLQGKPAPRVSDRAAKGRSSAFDMLDAIEALTGDDAEKETEGATDGDATADAPAAASSPGDAGSTAAPETASAAPPAESAASPAEPAPSSTETATAPDEAAPEPAEATAAAAETAPTLFETATAPTFKTRAAPGETAPEPAEATTAATENAATPAESAPATEAATAPTETAPTLFETATVPTFKTRAAPGETAPEPAEPAAAPVETAAAATPSAEPTARSEENTVTYSETAATDAEPTVVPFETAAGSARVSRKAPADPGRARPRSAANIRGVQLDPAEIRAVKRRAASFVRRPPPNVARRGKTPPDVATAEAGGAPHTEGEATERRQGTPTFRVRLKHRGGPRSRTMTLRCDSAEDARRRIAETDSEGKWEILELVQVGWSD